MIKKISLLIGLLFCTQSLLSARVDQLPMRLWYDSPAKTWMNEALPIGNGELGAMFFGGVGQERIQFNEKTLWTGSPTIRGAYQNFGDLYLNFDHKAPYQTYQRELDLDNSIGRVRYVSAGVEYFREYISSYPDKVIALRITTPKSKGKISFSAYLKDAHKGKMNTTKQGIRISGKLDYLHYAAALRIIPQGGSLTTDGDTIRVRQANSVTLYLSGGTDFDIEKPNYLAFGSLPSEAVAQKLEDRYQSRLNQAERKGFATILKRHKDDYHRLYNRVRIDLGEGGVDLPTNKLVGRNLSDNYLDALYFQYGRYLLISSSRGMNLPNNLQGLWNDSNTPPWESDIHTNINIQMNYWPAEVTALSECHMPFLKFVSLESRRSGGGWQAVAKKEGLRGWSLHTQSNIFGQTDWNINRPTNAWYSMHLWQHYLYTRDLKYLRGEAFPVMKSSCEYWFDRLRKDERGYWVAPSEWSPEHGPWEDGIAYAQQLIAELFESTLTATRVLGESATPFAEELAQYYQNLDRGLHIGSWGQLKEWKKTEDNPKDEHRHVSHLIALYPGRGLSLANDTTLISAARTSLTARGDQGTGWSRAWKISLWARLKDGNHAYRLLRAALNPTMHTSLSMSVMDGGVYDNLFDAHPPFQIDGNFGATAGIAEMLMQSPTDIIEILPALPDQWKAKGAISGLRANGAFEVSFDWEDGKIQTIVLRSLRGFPIALKLLINSSEYQTSCGTKKVQTQVDKQGILRFPTKKGAVYKISCKQ